MDDLILHRTDMEQHEEMLQRVMERPRYPGLKLIFCGGSDQINKDEV